jgi:hypothetical protein
MIIGSVLFLLLLALAFFLHRMLADVKGMDVMSECSESEVATNASPGGEYVASVFVRNCGATTAYMTHVNIRRAKDRLFTEEYGAIKDGEVASMAGTPQVSLNWAHDTDLEIEVVSPGPNSSITTSEQWKSVHVRMKELTRRPQ